MKTPVLSFLILFLSIHLINAQVAINTDGSPADSSAMLDIKSTEMGFLPPRLTAVEKQLITNPAEGLIIYNTTTKSVEVYNGATWMAINSQGLRTEPFNSQVAIGGSSDDEAYSIIQTEDGGFLIGGNTSSYGAGNDDFYAVKLSSDLRLETGFGTGGTFTFGGTGNDGIWGVAPSDDGGFVLGGFSQYLGVGGYEFHAVKITSEGALDNTFGTAGAICYGETHNDRAFALKATTDGGYIMAGYHSETSGVAYLDGYILKLNANGSVDNGFGSNGSIQIGGSSNESLFPAMETSDGGYLFVGDAKSYGAGGVDMYAIKLTSTGALDNSFGVNGTLTIGSGGDEYGKACIQCPDGGYLLLGQTNSFGAGGWDIYVVKLTAAGSLDTGFGTNGTLTFGGSGYDAVRDVIVTSDGSFLLAGYTDSYGAGGNDVYLVKLSDAGVPDNSFGTNGTLTIGGAGDDYGYSVIETDAAAYVLAGYTTSFGSGGRDMLVVRVNAVGEVCGNGGFGGGITGSGGVLGSGGAVSSGGTAGSGGTSGSGGTHSSICN